MEQYKLKEQYKKETGREAIETIPRYAGDRFGYDHWSDDYVEWLEGKLTQEIGKRKVIEIALEDMSKGNPENYIKE